MLELLHSGCLRDGIDMTVGEDLGAVVGGRFIVCRRVPGGKVGLPDGVEGVEGRDPVSLEAHGWEKGMGRAVWARRGGLYG